MTGNTLTSTLKQSDLLYFGYLPAELKAFSALAGSSIYRGISGHQPGMAGMRGGVPKRLKL
jgi:hypothetical protein